MSAAAMSEPKEENRPRKPYHELVAETLIEQLKQGTAPWRKPWKLNYDPRPMNPVTGKPYRGVNNVFLTMSMHEDPRWMTFNQARELGYTIRKGEHGAPVQYWKWSENRPKLDDAGKPIIGADGKPEQVMVSLERPKVFFSTVFNADQMDGVPPLPQQELTWNPVERAERLIQDTQIPVLHDGLDQACYRPSKDTIHMPARESFPSESDYYSTVLHEIGHATGHPSRPLHRDLSGAFGSESYAREELIAEIASMMLGQELRLDPRSNDNTAAYVNHWVKLLTDHPLEILRAAATAEKIKEYVMNRTREMPLEESLENSPAPQDHRSAEAGMAVPSKRQYIFVPYKEKGEAKELGAKWDGSHGKQGSWYIPDGLEVAKFQKWINRQLERKDQQAQEPQGAQKTGPLEQSVAQIVRLSVPYKEKDETKALGARYNKTDKCWYVYTDYPNCDRLCSRWSPEVQAVKTVQEPGLTPREEFSQFLEKMGMVVTGEHPVFDGQSHRLPVQGDIQGETSGFYVVHPDGRPAGFAQNHRTIQKANWKAMGLTLSDEEKSKLLLDAKDKLDTRNRDLTQQREEVARECAARIGALEPLTAPTQYLKEKGLDVHEGVYVEGDSLLVPAYNVKGELRTVQTISADGNKRFFKGGEKSGNFHIVGGGGMDALKEASVLVIAEGYATAATVSEALGFATVAAFDAGNLKAVATALHEAMPEKGIVIAGDDDRSIIINTGRLKAEAAAKAVGGQAVFPVFGSGDAGTDFNDMAKLYGSKVAVATVICSVLDKVAERNSSPDKARKRPEELQQLNDTVKSDAFMKERVFIGGISG